MIHELFVYSFYKEVTMFEFIIAGIEIALDAPGLDRRDGWNGRWVYRRGRRLHGHARPLSYSVFRATWPRELTCPYRGQIRRGHGASPAARQYRLGSRHWRWWGEPCSAWNRGSGFLPGPKSMGLSGIILLTTSVVVMIGLFIYTQLETQAATKQAIKMEKEGIKVGREIITSKVPAFFQRISLYPIVRCRTARIVISMWVIVIVGAITGVLAGFLGVRRRGLSGYRR